MTVQNIHTRPRGYWISEVMMAIWLLTFIGAGLIATFTFMAKGSQVTAERAAGELLAETLLQTAVNSGPPDWGQSALNGTSIAQTGDSGSTTTYTWVVTPVELESATLGKLFQVTVELSWHDTTQGPAGVERGSGKLKRIRQVYIEDI